MDEITFGEWLQGKLTEKEWKPADLARASGLDPGVLSNLINGKRNPGVESCKAIAKALKIPLAEVYRAADFMPPEPNKDPLIDAIVNLTLELTAEEKENVYEYVKLRHKITSNHAGPRKRPVRGHAGT